MASMDAPKVGHCRFCGQSLSHIFVDLGMSPLCQTHIAEEQRNHMEPFYPSLLASSTT